MLCRKPTEFDLKVLRRAYEKQAAIFAKDDRGARDRSSPWASRSGTRRSTSAEHAALSAVCLAILNLDEALTRE